MLRVSGLTKFFGDKLAVDEVSFEVKDGKIFGLLGRNGAGKSTIFRSILDIITPDAGNITYNGEKINKKVSDEIGYLPEEGSLILTYTVYEQLLYYGSLKSMNEGDIKDKAFYWLKKFKILEYINMKIKDLSKGNRQKIQFIVAVLHDPKLIILDEPFSGLDPLSVEELKNIILELKNDEKSIIFSSHRMDHVEMLCEDILIIDKGKTLVYGNLEEIKNQYTEKEVKITGEIGKYTYDIIKNTEGIKDIRRTEDNSVLVKVENNDMIHRLFNLLKTSSITSFSTNEISLNDIFIDKVGSKYEE